MGLVINQVAMKGRKCEWKRLVGLGHLGLDSSAPLSKPFAYNWYVVARPGERIVSIFLHLILKKLEQRYALIALLFTNLAKEEKKKERRKESRVRKEKNGSTSTSEKNSFVQ